MNKLVLIQNELKAPKSQFNKFGKYKYRNQEDILEAVKPLLLKHGCILTIKDRLLTVNTIMYIESVCTFTDGEIVTEVTAQAGIDPNAKGMNLAQCFGASSSYARKYALSGLFLLDDTKDADATNEHGSAPKLAERPINTVVRTEIESIKLGEVLKDIKNCNSTEDLSLLWDSLEDSEKGQTKAIFSKRKLELS